MFHAIEVGVQMVARLKPYGEHLNSTPVLLSRILFPVFKDVVIVRLGPAGESAL